MTTRDPSRRRPVVEVLYVQDCPHYQATLALVERVRAELGIDADLHSTLVVDQAAAEQARFPGSPTVRVDGHDIEPGSEPATEYLVGCRLYQLGAPLRRPARGALGPRGAAVGGRPRVSGTGHAANRGWRSAPYRTTPGRAAAARVARCWPGWPG